MYKPQRKRLFWLLFPSIAVLFGATYAYSMKWNNGFVRKPLYKLKTKEKIVALTFDDGPSLNRTIPLIALLNKYNVKATFFMLGENIEKYPQIARDVYLNGNLIGNHSYNHPKLVFKLPSFIYSQITRTDDLIKSIGQDNTIYFRPPYSAKYIVLPIMLKKMNKVLVTGSYDPPAEYNNPINSNDIANQIITSIEPGSIIFLHDGKDSDSDEFIKAVELVIIKLKEMGYHFVRIDGSK